MQGEGIGKLEARRNVESFLRRVRGAEASSDTTAWKKKARPFHRVVDGHKLMRARTIKDENVTLNRKLNRIMSEDRRKLTKEYAPGFRVGNVSSGMCIDCYRTENPLSLAYDKLHNRAQIRDREAKVIARHNAELRANINKLQSPYSAEACDSWFKKNRYRARFFLDRKEDPHTTKHLGLDPRERRRKKLEEQEQGKGDYDMESANRTDALGQAEALAEALTDLDIYDIATGAKNKQARIDGQVFVPSGTRTGGRWESRQKQADARSAAGKGGIERNKSPAYHFGVSMERLMNASLAPIYKPPKAVDDNDISHLAPSFPLPYDTDIKTRPKSAGVVPDYSIYQRSENGQDRVQSRSEEREVKDDTSEPAETPPSPRSNERNLLKELIAAKSRGIDTVNDSDIEVGGAQLRTRKMRIIVQDDICVSDVGSIKRLSEFPQFTHIESGSERDVDISTSTGILIEADGALSKFVNIASLMDMVSEMNFTLSQALGQLACLDRSAGLFECISDLDPEFEQALGDFFLVSLRLSPSDEDEEYPLKIEIL